MEYKLIHYTTQNHIGIITVDRPEALNALNKPVISEIRSVLDQVKNNSAIKALIFTGAGEKAFAAGADIREIEALVGLHDGFEFLRNGQRLTREMETLGIPTIAAINGLALGGGFELAMACTLRIVSENAKLGLPELGLGVVPGYGGGQRLVRLIGRGRALYYLLTGDMIDAETAVDIGLANLMVKPEMLMDQAIAVAEKIAAKAPLAVKMSLLSVQYGAEIDLDTALILETGLSTLTVTSKDKSEGIAAFTERRKPAFQGR